MSTITRRPPSPAVPMETTPVPDEERGVMRDVSWEFYDRISDAIGEQSHIRLAYDGEDMEIMTLGPNHERSKNVSRPIRFRSLLGADDRFRADGLHDLEAIEGERRASNPIYVTSSIKASSKPSAPSPYGNPTTSPTIPTLTWPSKSISRNPRIDRPKIYAALKVSEIWRFKKNVVVIEQLQPNRTYLAATSSRFLPVRAR